MTIKIIDADDLGVTGYRLTIDLDAANPADAADDPDRIMTLDWGSYASSKNDGETKPQYLQRIRNETRALAREAAAKRGVSTATKVAALVGVDIT